MIAVIVHGTNGGYQAGCRCTHCRAAAAAYQRQRRRRNGETTAERSPRVAARHFELSMEAREWMLEGECRHVQSVNFFPDTGENSDQAKAVCDTCPVKAQCLEHAITFPEYHGVWGGTTPTERKQIRGRRMRTGAA